MARIKIELPEKFAFSASIPVRITDINYGGHVGNDNILSFIHEARIQFLRNYGYEELNLAGRGLIMSDVAISFHNELFYGDTLEVFVTASDFTRVGFDVLYKMMKKSTAGSVLVASAKTAMVCYDYELKKVSSVPEAVKQKLAGF